MNGRETLQVIIKHSALAAWALVMLALATEVLAPGSVSALFPFLWLVLPAVVLALLVPGQEPRRWMSVVWSVPLAVLLGLYTAMRTDEVGRSASFLGALVGLAVLAAAWVLAKKQEMGEDE